MDVNGIVFGNGSNLPVSSAGNVSAEDFAELLGKVTGGKMAEEIRQSYNVTLDVCSAANPQELLDRCDIRCLNYVCISSGTLERMEKEPALKRKVLNAIREFSSPEEQAKVKALVPPVKSAGMLVYPDGEVLYWLEGYPNDLGKVKGKKTVVEGWDFGSLRVNYEKADASLDEEILEAAMQVFAGKVQKRGNSCENNEG